MSNEQKHPQVTLTVEGHIAVISLDNTSKKNAITPELMQQLSQHLTTFDDDDNLWVAVLDPASVAAGVRRLAARGVPAWVCGHVRAGRTEDVSDAAAKGGTGGTVSLVGEHA